MDDKAVSVASSASGASNLSWNTSLSRTSVSSLSCATLSGNRSHSAHGLDDVIRVVRTLNLQRYRYEDLSREEVLGEGETYVVERCVARNENIFAVKHLKVSSDAMFHKRLRSVILELQIMRHPPFKAHPNIMPGLGYGWNTKGNIIMPYVVVEYASLGTLRDYITGSKPSLYDIETLLGDVASGLAALHTGGIVHGDMKLDNVLVFPSMDRPAKALAKIADFGHALILNDASKSPDPGNLIYSGTLMYNAPEVEDQGRYPIDRADLPRCDIWALGLLIWEACIGGKDYLSYLREKQIPTDVRGNDTGFEPGDLLGFAKGSLPKVQLGPAMFIRIALHKTLQKDPTMRAPDARSLLFSMRWNSSNASGLQAQLALHIDAPHPTYEIFRLDNNKDIPWAHQHQILQSMEQTFLQDRLAKEAGQILWQIALCYHVGFGTARDAGKAFEFACMAKASGHPVAAVFSHLLGPPEELDPHQSRDSYVTRVLRLLRSNPAASAGMPPLVEAFYEDEDTVYSLFDETASSSTIDDCGQFRWLFAFRNEKTLAGIVDRLLTTNDVHLAALVNEPFSAPREIHGQWPLKLFGSPLVVAISVDSLMAVKALLTLGADPFSPIHHETEPQPEDHRRHWTAFHIAAKYHCSDILQYLVENSDLGSQAGLSPLGCALSFSTSLERLAIHGPGRTEQLDRTVRIIESIQPLTAMASNGMTALMQAIDFHDRDVAASLLRAAPELAETPFVSPRGEHIFNLPIHFAAQIASHRDAPDTLEIAELINSYTQELSASVAPARDHDGRTPLHLASTGPSNLITTWILQKKRNLLHVHDDWGRIPLHYCTSAATSKFLVQQGARVDHTDKLGMTALHRASLDGASELVTSLLEAKPRLDLNNNIYGTPLHCAVVSGSVDIIRALVEAGGLLNATDRMGNTAVHVAARLGRHQILRILIRYGADTTLKNIRGHNARDIALHEGGLASKGVLFILDSNLNPDPKRKQNHAEPCPDGQTTDGQAQQSGEENDFLWTKQEMMARDGGDDTDSSSDSASEQGDADDQHDDDPVDSPEQAHDVVTAVVVDTSDCLVESPLALTEGSVFEPVLASQATGIMPEIATDLPSVSVTDLGLHEWPPGNLAKANNRDGGGTTKRKEKDNKNGEDDTHRGAHSGSVATILDKMIAYIPHLALSTKPQGILPGRGR